jgi:hypothetical protein
MEPMLISESSRHRASLSDAVLKLTQRASAFRSRLPEGLIEPLSSLVREMNCYYSNLIEGHNTHPVDIQRALFGETSQDPRQRDLQQEAVAHISVQRWIDEGGLGTTAATASAVLEIHRRFYDALPESLKWVQNPETGERLPVIPGAFRSKDVSDPGQSRDLRYEDVSLCDRFCVNALERCVAVVVLVEQFRTLFRKAPDEPFVHLQHFGHRADVEPLGEIAVGVGAIATADGFSTLAFTTLRTGHRIPSRGGHMISQCRDRRCSRNAIAVAPADAMSCCQIHNVGTRCEPN